MQKKAKLKVRSELMVTYVLLSVNYIKYSQENMTGKLFEIRKRYDSHSTLAC